MKTNWVLINLIVSILCICVFGTNIFVHNLLFHARCSQNLKLAGDASSIENAKEKLGLALQYIEQNKMTQGSSSWLYDTPETDLGYWYKNLQSAKDELDKVQEGTSQLERTNILMKLRETLLDHSNNGDAVTLPSNVSLYPFQVAFMLCFWASFIYFVVMVAIVLILTS